MDSEQTCKHDFIWSGIISDNKGSTMLFRCKKCNESKEEFTSRDELRLFGARQQLIKTQKMLGTYKEPIPVSIKRNEDKS